MRLSAATFAGRALLRPAVVGVAALLFLVGCGSSPAARWILTANDLQDAAGRAYEQAKVDELAAGKVCAAAARAAGKPLPAPDSPEARPLCASLGTPLPYDPVGLRDLAEPINVAYETVRAADAVRKGIVSGDPVVAAQEAADAVWHALKAASDLGLAVPLPQATSLQTETRK